MDDRSSWIQPNLVRLSESGAARLGGQAGNTESQKTLTFSAHCSVGKVTMFTKAYTYGTLPAPS